MIGGQLLRASRTGTGCSVSAALVAAVLFAVMRRYLPETCSGSPARRSVSAAAMAGISGHFRPGQFVCLSLALSTNFAGFFAHVPFPVFLIRHLGLPRRLARMFIPMVGGA